MAEEQQQQEQIQEEQLDLSNHESIAQYNLGPGVDDIHDEILKSTPKKKIKKKKKKKKKTKKKKSGDTVKNNLKTTEVSPTTLAADKDGPDELTDWTCISCTFLNNPARTLCEMCQTERPLSLLSKPEHSLETKKTEKGKEKDKGDSSNSDDFLSIEDEEEYDFESEQYFLEDEEPLEVLKEKLFKVLTDNEVKSMQRDIMKTIGSELKLTKWNAGLLLQYFKWNINKLHSQYWDNKKKIKRLAGIKKKKKSKKKKGNSNEDEPLLECLVCCDDVKSSEVFMLGCGHGPYCPSCWSNHLTVTVKGSGADGIINVKCMWPRCRVKINYKDFKKLATPDDFARYSYFFTKFFVDCNNKMSFCPNPSCNNVILCQEDFGRPAEAVECVCGQKFCFACGMENHNPVTCDQLSKWQERNSDDQESIKLVMATSKPCFHCGIPTTRIDGCNHMTCRKEQGGCGGEWCWMCRGDWKSHGEHTGGFYSCNKYESSDAKSRDDQATKMKEEADRYLHYFNRFFVHQTANKSIETMKLKAIQKAEQYREETAGNPEFFMEAVELLQKCRHFLKYTYAYGYYIPDSSKAKEFFEYLQANAEGITERLADEVNAPLSEIDITAFKNRIRVTQKYIDNLAKGIQDGLGVEGLDKK